MPATKFDVVEKYRYLNGFNCYHESEAVDGALPVAANSPQKPPYGLYAEKLSGTAFTAPRCINQQSWLYRVLPSSSHTAFERCPSSPGASRQQKLSYIPNQLRWDPFDLDEAADWVGSLHQVAGAGDPTTKSGLSIYIFAAGRDMPPHHAFYSADGDFLVVPQRGTLDLQTEFGNLLVRPGEICVVPRGIKYRVDLIGGPVRGYVLELYEGHFQLPDLGPIGSNGLANARDFQAPQAAFEDSSESSSSSSSSSNGNGNGKSEQDGWRIHCKFAGDLFVATQTHSPFDVVAWHGQYYPYKYDLGRFCTIGALAYDHPDPSIFTVLTAPSAAADRVGSPAVADFVIFPPRWLVAEHTFRPPWYHRNCMSEFMGLIAGDYDAKAGTGFRPAGASLHNIMSGHGPDAITHQRASEAELLPVKVGEGSMAFMFESSLMLGVTDWGLSHCQKLQHDYTAESWQPLKAHFQHPQRAQKP